MAYTRITGPKTRMKKGQPNYRALLDLVNYLRLRTGGCFTLVALVRSACYT
jgi:hypothetical protein